MYKYGNHLTPGLTEVRKLVFTASAWAGRLVPELAPLCRRERQAMLWTEPLNAAPFPSDRSEGFKIGKYHLCVKPVPDPDRRDRDCSPEVEAGVGEEIAAYFPRANGPTRRMVACMFTTQLRRALHPGPPPGHGRRVHRRRLLRPLLQVLQRGRPHHGGLLPGGGGGWLGVGVTRWT